MYKIIMTAVLAASALTGAAQAETVSNYEFLQAARCRGLAASEGLGKLDTAGLDAFLKAEGHARELPIRTSAANKSASAQKEADKAQGAKKDKLMAERNGVCTAYLGGAASGGAAAGK